MSRATDNSLRQFVGYGIKRAFNAIQADLNASLAPFDLRLITYSALSIIQENTGLNQSQLSQLLAIERPNLVAIVDELERRGLVLRVRAAEDRRSNALSLTEDGARLFEQAQKAVRAHEARMTARLTGPERTALMDCLTRIEFHDGVSEK